MENILVTDGGPHSAEKWAEATSSHIVDIAQHVAGEKRAAAVKLQAAIIDILEGHHTTVQNGERAKLAGVTGHDRLQAELDPEHHLSLEQVVAEIIAAANGTPWEADFNYAGQEAHFGEEGEHYPRIPSMAENLTALLSNHFASSMHIERSWHADRNPAEHQSIKFKQTHNLGGV